MRRRQVAFPAIFASIGAAVAILGARGHVDAARGVGVAVLVIAFSQFLLRWPWRSRSVATTPSADLAPVADVIASAHPNELIQAIKEFRAETGTGLREARAQILEAYARREY